jgi:hypothetical protein
MRYMYRYIVKCTAPFCGTIRYTPLQGVYHVPQVCLIYNQSQPRFQLAGSINRQAASAAIIHWVSVRGQNWGTRPPIRFCNLNLSAKALQLFMQRN